MLQIAVFASGGGTNFQSIIDAVEKGDLKCEIKTLISNKKNAYALERAKKHNIPSKVIPFNENFEQEVINELDNNKVDLIVLAGFLRILPKQVIKDYENRIINIHPSLIPSFSGKGYYGLRVHEEALKRGVKITGATVHFVNEGADEGPIIIQKAVHVQDDDTAEILQKRVMEEAEHTMLVEAIKLIAEDKIIIEESKVKFRGI